MRLLALALAFFLAACVTPPIATPPTVTLAGLDLESIGLFEQRYILKLRVRNPNNVDIPLEGLNFDLELNGRHFADGFSNERVTIPRLGEAVLNVKATSNLADFLRQWQFPDRGGPPGLDYRIKGDLLIAGYGRVPFDRRGETSLPKVLPGGDGQPKPLPGAV